MEDGVAESNEQTELVSEGVDEGGEERRGENKRKEVDQEEIGGRKKIAKPDQTKPGEERREAGDYGTPRQEQGVGCYSGGTLQKGDRGTREERATGRYLHYSLPTPVDGKVQPVQTAAIHRRGPLRVPLRGPGGNGAGQRKGVPLISMERNLLGRELLGVDSIT
jgi:hypothetical protein